jgi:hypothetical protein
MPAKAGMSSAPHCGHLLTNNLFIGISSTPILFLIFGWHTRCDAGHTKNLESMAGMTLQQAAAKLLSKDKARRISVNIAQWPELFRFAHRGKGIIHVI